MAGLNPGPPANGFGPASGRRSTTQRAGWEDAVLRMLEFFAYPVLAGCALLLLSLGVVTWLPALAAAANALQEWRAGGRARPFLGTLRAFGRYWRQLWRHALASTAAVIILVANIIFLANHAGVATLALLAFQFGLLLALVPYHLALAVCAARDPEGSARSWARAALLFAFASPGRGLGLLVVAVATPILTAPLALGPLLLSGTFPLLYGLHLADRVDQPTHLHPPLTAVDEETSNP